MIVIIIIIIHVKMISFYCTVSCVRVVLKSKPRSFMTL